MRHSKRSEHRLILLFAGTFLIIREESEELQIGREITHTFRVMMSGPAFSMVSHSDRNCFKSTVCEHQIKLLQLKETETSTVIPHLKFCVQTARAFT